MSNEPLVLVAIPPLVTILEEAERAKGRALSEAEVLAARGQAICMQMAASRAQALAEARGFQDISLENAWADWQRVRSPTD